MAGMKQTFRYRDPRETRLLNQASKDQYGRQRNHVLYGFDWTANGSNRNQISLGRGAIYTQDGVKIFFDDTISFSIPVIDPSQGLTGGPAGIIDFPYPKNIIVGIQHNFVASATAQEAKIVLIEVRTSQKDQEPAYYIQEIDTITLTPLSVELSDPDRLAYNGLYDTRPGGAATTVNRIATQKIDNSIPNNITPILKVRIQQIHTGGFVTIPDYLFTGSGQLTAGVEIIRYKNMWNQLNDLIGVNIFEPVIDSDQNSLDDLNYTMTKGNQTFGKNAAVTLPTIEENTPTQHPLFGSFDPAVPNNYAGYRFSSFLQDGKSILEGMKRLDAWMRLLVNRTGDQSLIDESLLSLQDIVNKGLAAYGDPIVYGSNFMLQDGNIYHDGTLDTGDSYRRALHFLDNSISYICNRLGMTPIMTRGEIVADSLLNPESWDMTNPPGLDITANMSFHAAIQALRDYFTSRGNDVITGRHIYSVDGSDRIQTGDPIGQKVIINDTQVKVTNDTAYIDITDGSIDSSDARSDKIAGVEVATLDSASRYRVNKIASHLPARISNNQGPLVEGVINATQGKTLLGALENILDYNPQWNIDQLQRWAGNTSVVHNAVDGGLTLSGAALNANELTPDPYMVCKGIGLDWYYDLENLVMASAGPFTISLRFYDGSFAHIISRDILLLTQAANAALLYNNGNIIDGVVIGTNKPSTAVYYKVVINYEGSGVCSFKIRFGCNVSNSPILVNTPTGSDPRTLTRRDFVDAADALKQDNLVYDGTAYTLTDGHTLVGNSLRIVVGGITRYIPSSLAAIGFCHSNCHSHSNHNHDDCGRTNAW